MWDFVVLVALILAVADIVKRSIKRERFALLMFRILCRHGYRDSRFEHGLWVPKLNLAFAIWLPRVHGHSELSPRGA